MPIGRPLSLWQSTAGRYSPVMLSVAKHLAADRERPFAALRVTTMGSSRGDNTVMLSVAKHLGTPRTRPFATLRVTTEGANTGDTGRKQHG